MKEKEEDLPEKEASEEEVTEEILFDDDESSDLVIEIEEDLDDFLKPEEEVVETLPFDNLDLQVSKHAEEGKHRLKYDTIFKGKKDNITPDDELEEHINYENLEVDKSSTYWFESQDNENYIREKKVKERIYKVLSQKTDLNFVNNRRKPSRVDFNNYYYILKTSLVDEGFTNVEIFNELSVYFSDNLFNMFKLLDNKWRNLIIQELQDHIGKRNYSKDIEWRNIFIGTEVEFLWIDPSGNEIKITGAVIEKSEGEDYLKVDSYERYYILKLGDIIRILNNTKFKNNLNKLNNLDFL
ncbi:MAG: hypothetical protein EBY07_06495 [Actinobacteria bacterium]|nr:hypothetical protein [Actinomycetota bacterium]